MDIIWGKVTNIVDGDTFDINVTHDSEDNEYEYSGEERIRIADIDEPELNTKAGERAKKDLEEKLLNENVKCKIKSRDKYDRLVCDVYID
jgi:endonuclease YncB( thermonuclease family)